MLRETDAEQISFPLDNADPPSSKFESLHNVNVKPKQRYKPKWCSCGGCREERHEDVHVFQLICRYLDWVDLSILTLVSKTVARITISELTNIGKQDVEDEQPIMQKLRLMTCLEDWMPERFKFCHHCLLYLPLVCFDAAPDGSCVMECMQCLLQAQSKATLKTLSRFSCEGCYLVDAISRELDIESEGEAFEWQGPLISGQVELWTALEPCNTSSIAPRTRRQMARLLKLHKDATVAQVYEALILNRNLYSNASAQVSEQLRVVDSSRGAYH